MFLTYKWVLKMRIKIMFKTLKKFISGFLHPWKVARKEKILQEQFKDPNYINQHWFIKGIKYFWWKFTMGSPVLKKSILNGKAQLVLFIIQIAFIVIGYFYNTLLILFVIVFVAYLQFSSNSLVTTLVKNKHDALFRGLSEHYHANGSVPDIRALNDSLCNKEGRNMKQ